MFNILVNQISLGPLPTTKWPAPAPGTLCGNYWQSVPKKPLIMKFTKLIILALFLQSTHYLIGQLNPINDLTYEQTYVYPNTNCPNYNCFDLDWTEPFPSNDTLIGYFVYKDNEIWIFTEETSVTCSGDIPCEYDDFFVGMPFYAKVKAVYNVDSLESIANDSVLIEDIYIDIAEHKNHDISIINNPILSGQDITLLIPNSISMAYVIKITSINGEILKEYGKLQVCNSKINLSSNGLSTGVYIIQIFGDNRVFTNKLLII